MRQRTGGTRRKVHLIGVPLIAGTREPTPVSLFTMCGRALVGVAATDKAELVTCGLCLRLKGETADAD